jgi:hypothetical protein
MKTNIPIVRISRRAFLRTGLGGAAVVALTGGTGFILRDSIIGLQSGEVTGYLRENFHYLELEVSDGEMESFFRDFTDSYRPIVRPHWQRWLRGRDGRHFESVLAQVAGMFLLSTDFFLNGADESRPVRYVRFYNPYKSPCWNPLAGMPNEETT